MPVGEHENSISTGVHGHHRSLTFASYSGPTLSALDHDFLLIGTVFSVTLAIDIPESVNNKFSLVRLMYATNVKSHSPRLHIGTVQSLFNL